MTPEILAAFFFGFTAGAIFVFAGMLLDRRAERKEREYKSQK